VFPLRRLLFLVPLFACAQTLDPGWKELSFGPPTRNASRFNREGLRAEGIPFRRAIARAYGVPEYLVRGPEWIATTRYAITALISGEPETFQPLFQKALAQRFHLEARREKKDTAVYILTRLDDAPHKLTTSSGGSGETRFSDRSAELTDGDISGLVATLSQIVDRPVVDETGIGDRYDISLRWTSGDVGSLKAAVKEKLGLKLSDATRPIEFLVIDRVEKLQ